MTTPWLTEDISALLGRSVHITATLIGPWSSTPGLRPPAPARRLSGVGYRSPWHRHCLRSQYISARAEPHCDTIVCVRVAIGNLNRPLPRACLFGQRQQRAPSLSATRCRAAAAGDWRPQGNGGPVAPRAARYLPARNPFICSRCRAAAAASRLLARSTMASACAPSDGAAAP